MTAFGPKYSNKFTRYGGRSYHSKLEADYAAQLDLMLKAGEILSWEPQPTYHLRVNGQLICKILPDFHVVTKHGQEEIHETKSWATRTKDWHIKWKLLQALYPEFKYKVIMRGDI